MFPEDENGDVLRRFVSDGDDLRKPRDIDFVAVFGEESGANSFADQVRRLGHQVFVERTDSAAGCPWDARVVRHMVPDHSAISDFEKLVGKLAAQQGGRNDRWGCMSVSAAPDKH